MAEQKLSSGRFKEIQDELLDRFNASIFFDNKLYEEDIKGSLAHAKMLTQQGILDEKEFADIQRGLKQVKEEIENREFIYDIKDEDIHMAIEKRLTEIIGDAGKKLHTARSRNDQVAVDFRMYVLKHNKIISLKIKELIKSFVDLAVQHKNTILPGMTHLQHAQPISFAFHLLAYANMFKRDYERFISSYDRNNFSPLGCAALAGTPHNIDRFMTSEELGFKEPTINCLDTVSDRDFALEILFNISTLAMHMSRISEELIIWSTSEFKFVTISDKYATGSSIMPQKKNPDVPELIRGKTGRMYGNLISLLTVMKGLPLAYNKDTQEDKEGVFDSVENILLSLDILIALMNTLTINNDNMYQASKNGHLTATDLADYLAKKGVPFREAHHITGRAVALAEDKGIDLSELSLEELKTIDERIGSDADMSLENSLKNRASYGATSPSQVEKQIEYFKEFLDGNRDTK
jgi:argininosuccinate lyase